MKVCKVGALVMGGWVALSLIFPKELLRRQMLMYLALMVCSVPLWIIAADWGRFSVYYFMLAIIVSPWRVLDLATHVALPEFLETLVQRLQWLTDSVLVRVTALFALVESPFFASRLYGMDLRSLLGVLALGILAAAQLKGWIGGVQEPARQEAA